MATNHMQHCFNLKAPYFLLQFRTFAIVHIFQNISYPNSNPFPTEISNCPPATTMPPTPQTSSIPRLVLYHQTHHKPNGDPVPLEPLLSTHLTHLILAAIHINSPTLLHLNNHPPSHPRNDTLWAQLSLLKRSGIKVLGMLGGAAQGTFALLDGSDFAFEAHYRILHDFVKERNLDGLDLDVEEPMSLGGIIRLIDRLRADFGPDFMITLAPVAPALYSPDPRHNLSGFEYEALEVMRGKEISWYNAQFYCGWGDAGSTEGFEMIVRKGFDSRKVVLGVVTNGANGGGFVEVERLGGTIGRLRGMFGEGWGGVMGWEYFNAGDKERPWEWVGEIGRLMRKNALEMAADGLGGVEEGGKEVEEVLADGKGEEVAAIPRDFEYFTDEEETP
jgi:hypothetical protein